MNVAADPSIFEARDEPGLAQSVALAFAVHVLLALALFLGVRWQSKPPETIAVELWVPPAPVPERPEPPKPAPKVEPPPAPKPEPPTAKPEPSVEKPDIALKAPKPKPEPEKKKPEPPKPAPEPPRAKPVPVPPREDAFKRQMMEQLAREQAALQIDRERTQVLSELKSSANSQALADWQSKIQAKVRGNLVMPPDMKGNPEAEFIVTLLPTGEVLDAKLRRSSGVPAYDDAVERAIRKSSPLPRPDRPELHERELRLRFRPVQ